MLEVAKFFSRPRLQVALDLPDLDKAVAIAKEAWAGGADIVEAGTVLIKSEGMRAVKELRKALPDAVLYADLKTLDTGYLEARLALEAGADIVGVSALAGDETLVGALEAAKGLGGAVCADLIWAREPVARFKEVAELGCHIACFHVSVDAQRHLGKTAAELARYVADAVRLRRCVVAVAGGIDSQQAAAYARLGAKLIIVGSAIVKASDPRRATEKIRGAIENSRD